MRTFDYTKLAQQKWDSEILSYVAKIHEYKGRQDLYIRQKPVELDRLVEVARVRARKRPIRLRESLPPAPVSSS